MSTDVPDAEDSTAAEIARTDDPWTGPFRERTRYGYPTDAAFYRCRGCGIEVLTSGTPTATHREDCRFAED